MSRPAALPPRFPAGFLLTLLASLAVIAWVQSPAAGPYGYDGPYHLRYSAWIREHGVEREFPWWQETFLAREWADKDFLYHLLLIPFTYGDLAAGGKAASIVFAVALYAAVHASLALLRVRSPALWALACLLGSTTLLYRSGLVRAHVAAIALALLGTAAVLRGSIAAVAILAAAYTATHIAWHLLPAVALVHGAVRWAMGRRAGWGVLAAAVGGTVASAWASPFYPHNLKLWYVQNVQVLAMSWTPGAPDLGLGLELLPGRPADLLFYNAGPALLTLAGMAWLWRGLKRRGRGRDGQAAASVTLAAITAGFLALALLSRRFIEFWAPFSTLFSASAFTWSAEAAEPSAARRHRPLVAALLGGVLLLSGLHHAGQARRIVSEDPGLIYERCAVWIRDNVPEGATVFTTDWDEFPELFFFAPRQRYLVGLDPTFMHVTDPDRWALWREVAEARRADLAGPIVRTFRARHVFADAGYESFLERAELDRRFVPGVAGADCSVFSIRDREPERGALEIGPWWREGEAPPPGPGRADGLFVDVAAVAAPSVSGPDCAALGGRLLAERDGSVRLILATDDVMTVSIGGILVHDGAKPPPPPTLDEALAQHRSGGRRRHERRFEASVRAGYNDVSLTTCRSGRTWGFHLEAAAP
ncbi:MAG TPA: hypothetical protein VJV23_04730 [Candidatus Polarisedimenticolia bacterium]|nr:hypothetical protein [Candidatus Polarisedimenticolia bacterium]